MLKTGMIALTLALAACAAPHEQVASHNHELVRAIILASILNQTHYAPSPQQPLNCYSTGAGAGVIATCQ